MVIKSSTTVVLSTIFSVVLIAWFTGKSAQGQPALGATVQINLDRQQQCTYFDDSGNDCQPFNPVFQEETLELIQPKVEAVEDDPMLEKMPGLDFKAYRRADISSMYQEAPGSRVEQKPKFNGQAGKFVNMSPERLDLYWDGGEGPPGTFISHAGSFASTGTATFPGHVFYFIRPSTLEVVCSFRMEQGTSVYYCDPFVQNDPSDPSAGVHSGPILSFLNLNDQQSKLYDAAQFNREFASLYKNFTGGSEWLGNYPTKAPRHHMWRADYFGQEHQIQTRETHFTELPPQELMHQVTHSEMRRNTTQGPALTEYRVPGVMNITIKTVSVAPRIFQIDGFLSDVEVDQ